MHEISLAQQLLKRLYDELDKRPEISCIESVKISIGELSCVEPGSFKRAFRLLAEETEFVETELEIERLAVRISCQSCGNSGIVQPGKLLCSNCGTALTRIVSGTEFYLDSITVGENIEEK